MGLTSSNRFTVGLAYACSTWVINGKVSTWHRDFNRGPGSIGSPVENEL